MFTAMLHYFKYLSLLPLFFLSSVYAQAQPSELLWKISGNGLEKPSYLFGTMHVTDKLAFDQGDVVLEKIKECEAFSLEMHPDTLVKHMFIGYFDNYKENKAKVLLEAEEYEQFAEKVEQETGMKIDDLNTSEPFFIKQLLESGYKGRSDKSTFLDAHLYAIARHERKTIFGLERPEEQLDYFARNDTFEREYLRHFIQQDSTSRAISALVEEFQIDEGVKVYQRGNLEEIFMEFGGTAESTFGKERMEKLNQRNHTMVERLIPLMPEQSVFTAVGVMHLPGEEGMINLLKNKGYQLEAVPMGAYTGKLSDYDLTSNPIPWVSFEDKINGYKIETPTHSFSIIHPESIEEINLAVELGSGYVFMHTAVAHAFSRKLSDNAVLDSMVNLYQINPLMRVTKVDNLTFQDKPGRIIYAKRKNNYFKIRLIIRENIVYLQGFISNSRKFFDSPDAEKYFTSFEFTPLTALAWKTFTYEKDGFQVEFPFEPTSMQEQSAPDDPAADAFYKMIFSVNPQSGQAYFIGKYFLNTGEYIDDELYWITDMATSMDSEMDNSNSPIDTIDFLGKKAILMKNNLGSEKMESVIFVHGHSYYLIAATWLADSERTEEVDYFFDSFELLPLIYSELTPFTPADSSFLIQFPGQVISELDNPTYHYSGYPVVNTIDHYASRDILNSNIFFIETYHLSPFAHFPDKDSMYHYFYEDYLSDPEDSIIVQNSIIHQGLEGYEWQTVSPLNSFTKRIRIIPTENKVFIQQKFLLEASLDAPEYNGFFNDLEITQLQNPQRLFRSTKEVNEQILNLLASEKDSLFEEAVSCFSNIPSENFEQNDIYSLAKKYQEDSNGDFELRRAIVYKLADFPSEDAYKILTNYFASADSSELKSSILFTLSGYKNERSTEIFKNLMVENPDDFKDMEYWEYYDMFMPFWDSLELVTSIIPELLQADFESLELQSIILEYSQMALDSQLIRMEQLLPFEQKINAVKQGILDSIEVEYTPTGYYSHWPYNLGSNLKIWGGMNWSKSKEKEIKAIFEKYNLPNLRIDCIDALLANNVKVKSGYIDSIFTNEYYVYDAFLVLNKHKKTNLLPKKWDSKELIVKEMAEYLFEDEDYYYDNFEILSTFIPEGKSEELYFIKFGYEDYGDEGIMLVGAFDPKQSNPRLLRNYEDSEWKEITDEATEKAVMEELKKRYYDSLEKD